MSELKPTPMAHRVFDKQTSEYLQPQQHRADGKGALFIQEHVTRESFHGPFIDEIWTPAEPDRYTVERWTGLYDCNGSPIYEGDRAMHGQIEHEVVFWRGMFAMKLVNVDTNICCELSALEDDQMPEVIGTIHDGREG